MVDTRIILGVVGDELVIFARCDPPNFVAPKWNTPVALAINVSVASGTRQQMQTPITVPADVRPLMHLGMRSVLFTPVSGPD
jgi:hypothetical protein